MSACDPVADIQTSWNVWLMWSRGLLLAVLAALALVAAIWWQQNRSLTPEERLLFSKLDSAISHQPPRATDVIAAFDLPDDCHDRTCFLKEGNVGNLQYSSGNLRQQNDSIVFVAEGFSDTCIRSDRVKSYFGTGEAEQSCSHGGCWYTKAQHRWGILGFELDQPEAPCVTSVVINSLPYQRAEPVIIEVQGREVCLQNCEE